ncbi:MAG: hypothetical protein M3322_14075 [Actinomycetota bacterium]|nr:hypothetical protein [Actinomycetota bacterium]
MATTPPDETQRPSYAYGGGPGLARMPVPGNAEFPVYLGVWFVVFLLWLVTDPVDSNDFAFLSVILTFGYMLSRGIAKASRVLEQ